MRPIMRTTLCAFVAAAVAAPALTATIDFYLELGPVKGEELDARKGHENKIEVLSFSFGATRKGWNGTIKGVTGTEKFGAVSGAHRNADVAGGGSAGVSTAIVSPRDSASGLPTGKRQHGSLPRPLSHGSVTIDGSFPDCTVGAAYADALLQVADARYQLTDVQITSCPTAASSSGGDRPMESLSLNYAKIEVVYEKQQDR